MSYTHHLYPEAEDDLRELAKYFMEENLTVALNFFDAVEDSSNRIVQELNNRVRRSPRFDDVFAMPIKAERKRQNYAKDFSDYMLWYSIDEDRKEAIIWAIESVVRRPDRIIRTLRDRRKND